jgi:hypothetical protein
LLLAIDRVGQLYVHLTIMSRDVTKNPNKSTIKYMYVVRSNYVIHVDYVSDDRFGAPVDGGMRYWCSAVTAICLAPKFLDAHATTNVQFIAAPMQAASIAGIHKAVPSLYKTI